MVVMVRTINNMLLKDRLFRVGNNHFKFLNLYQELDRKVFFLFLFSLNFRGVRVFPDFLLFQLEYLRVGVGVRLSASTREICVWFPLEDFLKKFCSILAYFSFQVHERSQKDQLVILFNCEFGCE